MVHWNGNQLCAIDCETTGFDAHFHELIQIAIVPLDSNIQIRKDVQPFNIELIPDHPERADAQATEVHRLKMADLCANGFDREAAKDLLEAWIDKLGLPLNKGGVNRCKIIPLGQNYAFDMGFIKRWLGVDFYQELFHYHYKDTMIAAAYLNDAAAMQAEDVPYSKIGLKWLCNKLNVQLDRHHDALADAVATAEVYRRLLSHYSV